MPVKTYSYKVDGSKQITEHFKVKEFRSKDGADKILISDELVDMLEKLRAYLGCSIDINSGYRTEAHNKAIGGSKTSKHCLGLAADIYCVKDGKRISAKEVCCAAQTLGFHGIAYISATATHVDMRDGKWWADESRNDRIVDDFYDYFKIERPVDTSKFFVPAKIDGNDVNLRVREWQKACIADGYPAKKLKVDGYWGEQCEAAANICVCKKRLFYRYKNVTKIVQAAVGVKVDGYCGKDTDKAIRDYQKFVGLSADGNAGPKTIKIMLGVK